MHAAMSLAGNEISQTVRLLENRAAHYISIMGFLKFLRRFKKETIPPTMWVQGDIPFVPCSAPESAAKTAASIHPVEKPKCSGTKRFAILFIP